MTRAKSNEVSDLVWGARAIAEVIGQSERSTFHLLENEHLPAKRIGRRWCASRARLLAYLTSDEPAAA